MDHRMMPTMLHALARDSTTVEQPFKGHPATTSFSQEIGVLYINTRIHVVVLSPLAIRCLGRNASQNNKLCVCDHMPSVAFPVGRLPWPQYEYKRSGSD